MEEEAGGGVGADDAYGLEVGVDYDGANEFHAAVLEVVWDGVWESRVGGANFVDDFSICPAPEVGGEASILALDVFEDFRVGDGGLDFAPVANYFWVWT